MPERISPTGAVRPRQTPDGPTMAPLPEPEQLIQEEEEKVEKEEEIKTPSVENVRPWKDVLAEAKITEEQANVILDSMMTKGYWDKSYVLLRGRLHATLRTRDAYNVTRISKALDLRRNPTNTAFAELVFNYNLAGSMVKYQEVTLPFPEGKATLETIEDHFQKRLEFIDRLPSPVVSALYSALSNFDQIVSAALYEEAPTGF